ncbi:hypothetical protein RB601_004779 [Gaeumannomyces tritici]
MGAPFLRFGFFFSVGAPLQLNACPCNTVAVIGAGPAGAITLDALVREKAFDLIRVFERREGPGGCWFANHVARTTCVASTKGSGTSNLQALGDRTADPPLRPPVVLPAEAPRAPPRFAESSIYPYLETNVGHRSMRFSAEPIPADATAASAELYGPGTPFRHWEVLRRYVSDVVARAAGDAGDDVSVSYGTTVELVEKAGEEWEVTLRREQGEGRDYWWAERFDAVVVASGHYNVPYVPAIEGLDEFQRARPGSVLHSKYFRGRDHSHRLPFCDDKTVVVVGASVSAADIAFDLVKVAKPPVHAVVLGHTANAYFGDRTFDHPRITKRSSIARVDPSAAAVHLADGGVIRDADHIILGTGHTWTLLFLPCAPARNNRVPGLYQHAVFRRDPTLLFVGAVGAGLTFKIFEWQAVLAARLLAGRTARPLPAAEEMERWEDERVAARGDGARFTLIYPEFEEYFEELRGLAGEGLDGCGRKLPRFDPEWARLFMAGHELRKDRWRRINTEAAEEEGRKDGSATAVSRN